MPVYQGPGFAALMSQWNVLGWASKLDHSQGGRRPFELVRSGYFPKWVEPAYALRVSSLQIRYYLSNWPEKEKIDSMNVPVRFRGAT